MNLIRDLNIQSIKPLTPPALLIHELSVTDAQQKAIQAQRQRILRILTGEDRRLLVIIGPCSIHDPKAALEYADRLSPLAQRYQNELEIVMRVYFEKPRTTIGWKGLINDPYLDGTMQINTGLQIARKLLLDIAAKGIPMATEFLDTISPQYLADLISWGAIGARTAESQIHRELASGLSMPIGFKNATSGDLEIALDAIITAQQPHHFLSVTQTGLAAIVETKGNAGAHLVLRGGKSGPNYDLNSLQKAQAALQSRKIQTGCIVDVSHANSNKNPLKQIENLQEICQTLQTDPALPLAGVMIESHLKAGRQDLRAGHIPEYGLSITDACIGWVETEKLLAELAQAGQMRLRS